MEFLKVPEKEFSAEDRQSLSRNVEILIRNIRERGWPEVEACSLRFDRYEGTFRMSPEQISQAVSALPPELRKALEVAIENVRVFHRHQREICTDTVWETAPGIFCGLRFVPVESTGVYIPGGRYPLPSTAIMGVVPAQEAGVSRIAAFSPPSGPSGIHPVTLGALGLLGVREIWCLGGVQAIAAGALGIAPIKKVDMMVGPGNAYVTEAKRLLFGEIGIDGLAGPSEVLVIADHTGDPEIIAADLLAQSEHDPLAKATLLCLDRSLGEKTLRETEKLLQELPTREIARASWRDYGTMAFCSLEEAVDFANRTAPEHLELALENPSALLPRFRAYGAAFLGHRSGEAFGDYVAGTNHILPTSGAARFSGGLWTGTFLRPLTSLRIERDSLQRLCDAGEAMAEAEGLKAHGEAMKRRRRFV
jgi:histidinol dehydrogenase/sulfopropanediol 3-dehydrogenase